MNRSDERIQHIRQRVRDGASAQAQEQIEGAEIRREKELAAYRETVIGEMYRLEQQAVQRSRQEMLARIASEEEQSQHLLLHRRQQMLDTVMQQVAQRLKAFANTREYLNWLLVQTQSLPADWDHTHTTLELCTTDLSHADALSQALPGCTVVGSPTIPPGGFVAHNTAAGMRVDCTLSSLLEAQKAWLLQNCALQIREEGEHHGE